MMKDLATLASLMRGRDPRSVALQMIKNNGITDSNINSLVNYAQTGDTTNLVNLAQHMNNHITCVIDGVIYDTFDPSNRYLWCCYKVK